jgi:Flp pilus assembly protein TadD
MVPLIVVGVIVFLIVLVAIFHRAIMVDVIGQLVQSRPDDYTGWLYYGTLLEREGHYLEAYDAFEKAVTLSPTYAEAWKKIGDVLLELGNSTGAAEAYRFSNS